MAELAVAAVLFFALVFMQEIMRRQVHFANHGRQEIGPFDVRYANNLFGPDGIWNRHKRLHARSRVRMCFLIALIAFVVLLIVGASGYIYAHL
jgi:hypothetical protein